MKSKRHFSKQVKRYKRQSNKYIPYGVGLLFIFTLYQTQFFQNFYDAQQEAYDKHVKEETILSGIFDFSTPSDFLTLMTDLQSYVTEVITGVDFTQLYSFINDGFGFMGINPNVNAATTSTSSGNSEYKYRYVSEELDIEERPVSTSTDPVVYIYNTHTSEKYNNEKKSSDLGHVPSVVDASKVVSHQLESHGIKSIVELRDVGTLLHSNGWAYAKSYDAARMYLEDTTLEYDSLEYFVDIHRDAVKGDASTFEYKGESYAKVMFVVGREHDRHEQNWAFAEELEALLNEKCPGISRGIIPKQGEYVNGIYNQDFSPNTVLIEVGGVDNTYEEVENTSELIGDVLAEFIASQ